MNKEVLVVGVMQPLLLHEGGVFDQAELVGGNGPPDPGRGGGHWCDRLWRRGEIEGTGREGLHTEQGKIQDRVD